VQVLSHAAYLVFEPASPMPNNYTSRFDGDYDKYPYDLPNITTVLTKMASEHRILDATLYVFTEEAKGKTTNQFLSSSFIPTSQPSLVPWIFNVTRNAHKIGVNVSTGTDDIGDPNQDSFPNVHKELELLVKNCGFSPLEAITSATKIGAETIGIGSVVGTIEVGKIADMVILNKNPLDDITNTRKIWHVIKGGKLYL